MKEYKSYDENTICLPRQFLEKSLKSLQNQCFYDEIRRLLHHFGKSLEMTTAET